MPLMIDVWAAVPVKEFTGAKQRTASILTPVQRETLAATMLEDVLSALAGATRLTGILVNTVDPVAADLAARYGAQVVTDGALDGHTGAVNGMARVLAAEGKGALLTVPGDIPRVTSAEIDAVVSSCLPARFCARRRSQCPCDSGTIVTFLILWPLGRRGSNRRFCDCLG
jgi:2-phospho-L-lactate guanylyltransferase